MRLIPTRYFSPEDLEPISPPTNEAKPILPEASLKRIGDLALKLRDVSVLDVPLEHFEANPDVALFVALIHAVGAFRVSCEGDSVRLIAQNQLAQDSPYILFLFLKTGFPLFADWSRRCKTLPDRICALEFLHHMELQRMEYSKRSGLRPEILQSRPVAFAVIKARSAKRKQDVYLLELNKDWERYNLIGGKQEPEDRGDYHQTILREIEEELGVPRAMVQLTTLTEKPLLAFSLSGNRGSLASYPCMLFLAKFINSPPLRAKDKWFSEEELRRLKDETEPGLLINWIYLDFLFNELPQGLSGLDYSLKQPVDFGPWYIRVFDFLKTHKEWIVAILVILAALIAVIKALI